MNHRLAHTLDTVILSPYFNKSKTEIEKAWKRATRMTRSWEVGMASTGGRTGKARNHLPGQQGACRNMGMAHESTEKMAWNQLIILLFHIHMRGHEIKLSGAMLKKGKWFLIQQARPVGLPAEWYYHIVSLVARDLWTLPS